MRGCLVLDLDDTLYLERDYVRSGFAAIDTLLQKTHAAQGFFALAWQLFAGGQRSRVIDDTLAALHLPERCLAPALQAYRNQVPDICLAADAQVFLHEAAQHYTLALITDGRPAGQRAKVDALGIAHYFTPQVFTGERGIQFSKPHPDAYTRVMQHVGTQACRYIGDNPHKDFGAPQALGWLPSIRVRRPHALHAHLDTPSGCYEVTDLQQAWHWLQESL